MKKLETTKRNTNAKEGNCKPVPALTTVAAALSVLVETFSDERLPSLSAMVRALSLVWELSGVLFWTAPFRKVGADRVASWPSHVSREEPPAGNFRSRRRLSYTACVFGEPVRGALPDPSFFSLSGLEQVRAYVRGLVPTTALFRFFRGA